MEATTALTAPTDLDDGGLFAAERVLICSDRATGLRAIVVIDNTTCGPGLGGVRYHAYPSGAAALSECRRLASAMTFKHAAAELPYGGAKSVIVKHDQTVDRATLMRAYGRMVAPLGDEYIPAVDMGTTPEDIAEIGRFVADVECSDEDPAPLTALGVYEGIRAAITHVRGTPELEGIRVAIQGVGHVGVALARLLAADRAELLLADIDAPRAHLLAEELSATVIDNDSYSAVECDVLAPCAVARTVNPETLPGLRCRVVAGAANDVLADPRCAEALDDRGILYVPDFLLNAGGVVALHAKRQGLTRQETIDAVTQIGPRVATVLAKAQGTFTTPLAVAEAMALTRIQRESCDDDATPDSTGLPKT
jgi:leucine dehydrogenase